MGPIWGFLALIEKVFIQFISNLAVLLIGWVFRNVFIFVPVAKFLALCSQLDIQINKALIWKVDVVTSSIAVGGERAITDALIITKLALLRK